MLCLYHCCTWVCTCCWFCWTNQWLKYLPLAVCDLITEPSPGSISTLNKPVVWRKNLQTNKIMIRRKDETFNCPVFLSSSLITLLTSSVCSMHDSKCWHGKDASKRSIDHQAIVQHKCQFASIILKSVDNVHELPTP